MKKTLVALAALLTFFAGNAFALTYTSVIDDNWVNWAGDDTLGDSWYTSNGDVVGGQPFVDNMVIKVENSMLKTVTINHERNNRITFDSLFINTNYFTESWDSWDYYVIDRGSSVGQESAHVADPVSTPLAATGLYTVKDTFDSTFGSSDYTLVKEGSGRDGNPSGISNNELTPFVAGFKPVWDNNFFTLVYDFEGLDIDVSGGLFVAYSGYCANDVIGGAAVPEPGTLLLFGTGLMGMGLYRRFRKN